MQIIEQFRMLAKQSLSMLSLSAFLALFFVAALLTANAQDESEQFTFERYIFKPKSSPLKAAQQTVLGAKQQNKLAMIVLGAQWCHDSRDLSANFSKPEMQDILNKNYEVSFIDVGFLQDRRDVTEAFAYPNYFATPTVLIIDPNTQQVLNAQDLSTWFNASSVSYEDYLSYFETSALSEAPITMQIFHPLVRAFEKQQGQRLQDAYAVLSPFLEAEADGTLNDTKPFYQYWTDIRNFRKRLNEDMLALRSIQQASVNQLTIDQFVQPAGSWELD